MAGSAGEASEAEGGIVQQYRCTLVLCDQRGPGDLAKVDLSPEPAVTTSRGDSSGLGCLVPPQARLSQVTASGPGSGCHFLLTLRFRVSEMSFSAGAKCRGAAWALQVGTATGLLGAAIQPQFHLLASIPSQAGRAPLEFAQRHLLSELAAGLPPASCPCCGLLSLG